MILNTNDVITIVPILIMVLVFSIFCANNIFLTRNKTKTETETTNGKRHSLLKIARDCTKVLTIPHYEVTGHDHCHEKERIHLTSDLT